jgi:hypothetical protein
MGWQLHLLGRHRLYLSNGVEFEGIEEGRTLGWTRQDIKELFRFLIIGEEVSMGYVKRKGTSGLVGKCLET